MIYAYQVRKSFGEKEILKGIDLKIEKGNVFGLLGPSGAGKTTLIKLLTGQLPADGGEARILGKEVEKLTGKDKKKIGIMMDNFGPYERFSCYENLKIFADLYGVPKNQIVIKLKEVGLYDSIKTPAMKLSKGMRNRLQLARVFLQEPEIMFLDEPTSGLDPANTEEIHSLILDKVQRGCTVFLTTHNMVEAEKLCEKIALLNEGNIVEQGHPKEICRKYNHQKKIYIHRYDGEDEELSNNSTAAERLYRLMQEEQIETIHSTEPNLESVFMELTGKSLNV